MNRFAGPGGFAVGYSQTMKPMLGLMALIAGLSLALSGCGSGGAPDGQEAPPLATETPRSERVERQATIMQQQATQGHEQQGPQQAEQQDSMQAQQTTAETEQDATQDEGGEVAQVDVSADDAPLAGVHELGEIDFGHREGLPYLRNSVGDPDAPVVIVEYSDFQ